MIAFKITKYFLISIFCSMVFYACSEDSTINKPISNMPIRGAFEHLGLSIEMEEHILQQFLVSPWNAMNSTPWDRINKPYNLATIDDFEVVGYYGTYPRKSYDGTYNGNITLLSIQATGVGTDLKPYQRRYRVFSDNLMDLYYFFLDLPRGAPLLIWTDFFSSYQDIINSFPATPFEDVGETIPVTTYEEIIRTGLGLFKFYKWINDEYVEIQNE